MTLFGKKPEPVYATPESLPLGPPVAESAPAEPAEPSPVSTEDPELETIEATPLPPAYGILEAIRLMKSLPVDENTELVVRVIKSTLESMHVNVADIVEDADRQAGFITGKMTALNQDVVGLERSLEAKREELRALEAELAETRLAKERLLMTGDPSIAKRLVLPPAQPPPAPSRSVPPPLVRAQNGAEGSGTRSEPPKAVLRNPTPPSSPVPTSELVAPRSGKSENKASGEHRLDLKGIGERNAVSKAPSARNKTGSNSQ
jgi:hypothetical protein